MLVVAAILWATILCAQEEKHAVALMPFVASSEEYKSTAIQVQDLVLQQLAEKPNVEVIDRSKDKIVISELDNQIRAVSVAAKNLADQGKLRGAKRIIVGQITKVSAEAVDEFGAPINNSSSKSNSTGTKNLNVRYSGLVTFSLQLIDVETGLVIEQENFTGNTMPTDAANKTGKGLGGLLKKTTIGKTATTATQIVMPETKEKAIQMAITSAKKDIADWINKTFAKPITLVAIEERSKGAASTVLVTGLDEAVEKGTVILVHEVRYLDAGGKKVRQERKLASLKVQEPQGDVTLCKVTDGGKELEEKMNGNSELILKLK